jgi:hypothetical protein
MGVLTIEEQFNIAVTKQDLLSNDWVHPSIPSDTTYSKLIFADLMDLKDMMSIRTVFVAHYQLNTGRLTIKAAADADYMKTVYDMDFATIVTNIHNIIELNMITNKAHVVKQILNNPRYELRD